MRSVLLIYILSILLCSCKMQGGGQKPLAFDCAKDLVPFVKSNWTYVENGDYHIMSDTLKKAIEGKFYDCILQKDTSWLITNLGKYQNEGPINPHHIPNDKTVGSICYRLSKICSCKNTRCTFYFFFYDSTGKITKHNFDRLLIDCEE